MKDFLARFGLHTMPFTREFPIERRLSQPQFVEAEAGLHRAIEDRQSAALDAPAGTGKSVVLRALKATLAEARYRVHYVKVTCLSKRDMCREVALAVGAEPAGSYNMLVRRLDERFLTTFDQDGLRPVLLLDEAHDLRPDVLAMLRILTNYEMDSRLVVSIVLAGQPGLRTMLRRDEHEDVARRLAHFATLRPLSRQECVGYVEHRIAIAGGRCCPFDQSALDALFEFGRGCMRATDQLALKALQLAHDQNIDAVDAGLVVEARKVLWP